MCPRRAVLRECLRSYRNYVIMQPPKASTGRLVWRENMFILEYLMPVFAILGGAVIALVLADADLVYQR